MKLFLNPITLLILMVNYCVGKNTFSFYNLEEAFREANKILNYSNVVLNSPKNPHNAKNCAPEVIYNIFSNLQFQQDSMHTITNSDWTKYLINITPAIQRKLTPEEKHHIKPELRIAGGRRKTIKKLRKSKRKTHRHLCR